MYGVDLGYIKVLSNENNKKEVYKSWEKKIASTGFNLYRDFCNNDVFIRFDGVGTSFITDCKELFSDKTFCVYAYGECDTQSYYYIKEDNKLVTIIADSTGFSLGDTKIEKQWLRIMGFSDSFIEKVLAFDEDHMPQTMLQIFWKGENPNE